MGEYLAAPALLDEPAVQQSFLSYFNTIVVSPGDGACLSWSVMRALLLMPPCVREHLSCPAQRFLSERLDCIRKEDAALRAFHDFCHRKWNGVWDPSGWCRSTSLMRPRPSFAGASGSRRTVQTRGKK